MTEEQEQPGQDANGGADKVCRVVMRSVRSVRLCLVRSVRLCLVCSVRLCLVCSVRLCLVYSVRLCLMRSVRLYLMRSVSLSDFLRVYHCSMSLRFMMPVMCVAHFKTARDQ